MTKAEYSKRAIAKALLRLLERTDYDRITLQSIVDEAGVSRMSFYRNFENKNQVIKYYLDNLTDGFMEGANIDYSVDNPSEYFHALFRHLTEQRELGMLLLKAGLFDYIRVEFDRVYVAKAKNKRELLNYYFLSGGICNVYYYWLQNGCHESAEELKEFLIHKWSEK